MSYEHSYVGLAIWELKELEESGRLTFPPTQREQVWINLQKSLLIHSMLAGIKIQEIIGEAIEDGGIWFLDGKQRLTTALEYYCDGFKLHEETPDVYGIEIAGLPYSMLDDKLKKVFESRKFDIVRYDDLTDDERDTLFFRYNNGSPLKPAEILRAKAGTVNVNFFNQVLQKAFFKEAIAVPKKRNAHEQVLYQIGLLLYNDRKAHDLGGKDTIQFAEDLREHGIRDDVADMMIATTDYLSEALPHKEDFLKKQNVPMVFIAGSYAIEKGIKPSQFGGWVQSFFAETPAEYEEASKQGAAKKTQVNERMNAILEHMEEHIEKANDYVKPEVKESTPRGSRS